MGSVSAGVRLDRNVEWPCNSVIGQHMQRKPVLVNGQKIFIEKKDCKVNRPKC